MHTWPVQDAKARFSEFLEACMSEGPQSLCPRVQKRVLLTLHPNTKNTDMAGMKVLDFEAIRRTSLHPVVANSLIVMPIKESAVDPARFSAHPANHAK